MKFSKNVLAFFSTLLLSAAFSSSANSAVVGGTYNFDYTCATCTNKEVTFQLPSSPIGVSPTSDHFTVQNVSTSFGVVDLSFFLLANLGAFRIENATTNVTLIDIFGPQIFTGPLSNPTFTLGTFQTTTDVNSGVNAPSQLVISAVPEPTTVALLGLGLLGFAASRRNIAKK